ncbi:putative HNH endonuclease [Aeromonas phage PS2]|nr:putative HNH endonuclease [Aeromonas phage PS2]
MSIKTLTEILGLSLELKDYEDRVQKRYDYIQEQLKLDPEFVAYDYLEYWDGRADIHYIIDKYVIDTKGNYYLNNNGICSPLKDKENKWGKWVAINQKCEYFQTRRIVASMYVPKSDSILFIPYWKLDVKYKDGDSKNKNFDNLDWSEIKEGKDYLASLPKTLTEILGLKYDETMSYEERVQKRYNYVKEQLELDPNYEGWDVVEFISGGIYLKHLVCFNYLISTSGRVLTTDKDERGYKILTGTVGTDEYKFQNFRVNKDRHRCTIHRAVSSTFIYKPPHYQQKLNRLVVNHKDLDKLNNHFTNLEWCTTKENVRHRVLGYQATNIYFNTIFEGTVEIDCKYKGVKFKVFGGEGLESIGLGPNTLSGVFTKGYELSFGCSWKIINQEEADRLPDIPEFIKGKLLNDRSFMDYRIKPTKGTVVKDCEFKDLEFVIFGRREFVGSGFDQGSVGKAMKTDTLHQGCKWEFITRDEAELLPRGLTKEQMKTIITKRWP